MPFDHKETLVQIAAGVYVEKDTLDIVRRIRAYDSNLRVKYLDPDSGGGLTDAPYKIVEVCSDGIERVVCSVWKLDARVLERLYLADTQKHDILAGIDRNNAAVKEATKRRFKEELESSHDLAEHILKTPKLTYTIKGVDGTQIVVDSHIPVRIVTRTGLEVPQDRGGERY
ncbi:MAG: hypothetical protein ACRD8W_00500 [Nitrososphaeraceae archaeon]